MGGRSAQSRLSDDLDFQLHRRQREPSADERRSANYPHVRRDDLPMKSRVGGGHYYESESTAAARETFTGAPEAV